MKELNLEQFLKPTVNLECSMCKCTWRANAEDEISPHWLCKDCESSMEGQYNFMVSCEDCCESKYYSKVSKSFFQDYNFVCECDRKEQEKKKGDFEKLLEKYADETGDDPLYDDKFEIIREACLEYARSVVPEAISSFITEEGKMNGLSICLGFNRCREAILTRIQQDEDLTKDL